MATRFTVLYRYSVFSVQIIAYGACVVLLNNFDHDRTVRLRFFADDFVLRPVPVQRVFVLLDLCFDQLECIILSVKNSTWTHRRICT